MTTHRYHMETLAVLAEPYWICAKENLSEEKPYSTSLEDTVVEGWRAYFMKRAKEDQVEIDTLISPNTDPAYRDWSSVIEITSKDCRQ